MPNKTCGTCIDNDCGLCDRMGIWVEDDDDACDKHREKECTWQGIYAADVSSGALRGGKE